jgi:CDP-paratose 2-epimerase
MNYKTILITGGAGFVGSNLAVNLKQSFPSTDIIILDNLKRRGSELNINRLKEHGVRFIHGDIRTPEDLSLEQNIGLIIECSAEPSVLAGFGNNPVYVTNTNLFGTVNCLELARRKKADFIFISTNRIYPYAPVNHIKKFEQDTRFEWKSGQNITGWSMDGISEGFTTAGVRTLYGATKLASELIIQEYLSIYGLKGVINRCSILSGPWQFGKVDQGAMGLWMLSHYFKKELQYIGFGGKGKQVRDNLHIDDLCELIRLEILKLKTISGSIYNIGGGRNFSLSLYEATDLCRKITGNRIKIRANPVNRPGDIAMYITDTAKAASEIGWQPKCGPQKTFSDIYNWIRNNEKQLKQIL